MGLKIFESSKSRGKSDYYKKIDKMLNNSITDTFFAVMKVHNDAHSRKKKNDENWYNETLKERLQDFDKATKDLMAELGQLKSKNKTIYVEIESDIVNIRKDISVIKKKEHMQYIKELGEMFKKVRDGVSSI